MSDLFNSIQKKDSPKLHKKHLYNAFESTKNCDFHNLNHPISTARLSDPQKVMLLMTTRVNTKMNGGEKLSKQKT